MNDQIYYLPRQLRHVKKIVSLTLLWVSSCAYGVALKQTNQLPDLATKAAEQAERERINSLAGMTLNAGKAIQSSTQQFGFSDSTEQWIFNQIGSGLTHQVVSEGQELLQDYGRPHFAVSSDYAHRFIGSSGSLFRPLIDKPDNLIYSQFNLEQTAPGLLASVGVGRRWCMDNWIFGYNAFVDHLFSDDQNRATFGSELWSDYLLVSANYFSPLNNWQINDIANKQLMSHGFDLHTRGMLPFYRQVGVTLGWQYYLEDYPDDGSGTFTNHSPQSIEVGLTYHPVPLITLSALHKKFIGGEYQNQVGIQLNYQFGVALKKQLSFTAVNTPNKFALNYYAEANRYAVPEVQFQSVNTFQVYLGSKTLQVHPGQSLQLNLIVTPKQRIQHIDWRGDSALLSVTPPTNKNSTEGWTIIIPKQTSNSGLVNDYSLAVIVDNGEQRVTSNTIHFSVSLFE